MNKLTLVILFLCLTLFGCQEKVDEVDKSELTKQSIQVATSLDIRFEAQDVTKDGKRKVVMWLKNPTDKGFSGTITAYVVDKDGSIMHTENISLDDVAAKGGTWRVFWVKPEYLKGSTIQFKWVRFQLKE